MTNITDTQLRISRLSYLLSRIGYAIIIVMLI